MIPRACAATNDGVAEPREVKFESILPAIRRCAAYAFRRVRRSLREDLIAEAIANAYVAFTRLLKRGLAVLVYPTALARFAIRQVWDGRRVGGRRSAGDVLSEYAQVKQAFVVEQLDHQSLGPSWDAQLLTDRRVTPAELATCRLDFRDWIQRLSPVKRRVALRLAVGDTTSEVALRFRVSPSRISQLRRELEADWEAFQSQAAAA